MEHEPTAPSGCGMRDRALIGVMVHIEHAQQIANHASPRTTKLYDRTSDAISLDEIEWILIQTDRMVGFALSGGL
jgi:hypothetical protein